jgi:vacuolar-type H+-ATPase subunit I/STV1
MEIEELGRSGTEPDPPDNPQDLAAAIALVQQLRQREVQLNQRIRDLEATVEQMKAARLAPSVVEETSNHSNPGVPENRQQPLVEVIRKRLDTYQQRIAQMEEEHAQVQERYQEKTNQLQQVEHTCQELRSRLHRQQRHALQFKAALEKCLEAEAQQRSTPNADRSSTQFLFSTPPSVQPTSFSPPPQQSDLADTIESVFSRESEESESEPEGSSMANPPADGQARDTQEFLNSSSSEVYPESPDVDRESDAPSDADSDSMSPKKRPFLSNLDLPSFPRLS